MQEQVNERSVALVIKSSKITGTVLAKALLKLCQKLKNPQEAVGKQSVKKLVRNAYRNVRSQSAKLVECSQCVNHGSWVGNARRIRPEPPESGRATILVRQNDKVKEIIYLVSFRAEYLTLGHDQRGRDTFH